MSVSVVLGNAPAYAGGASFALFLVLLAWASAIDLRERRIPNKLVAAMAVLWLAVRVLLAAMAAACCAAGFGVDAQIGDAALVASAAMMRMIPFGLTLGDGLVGALVLGGWLACGLDRIRVLSPTPLHGRRGRQAACGGRTVPGLGTGAVVPVLGVSRRPCDAGGLALSRRREGNRLPDVPVCPGDSCGCHNSFDTLKKAIDALCHLP